MLSLEKNKVRICVEYSMPATATGRTYFFFLPTEFCVSCSGSLVCSVVLASSLSLYKSEAPCLLSTVVCQNLVFLHHPIIWRQHLCSIFIVGSISCCLLVPWWISICHIFYTQCVRTILCTTPYLPSFYILSVVAIPFHWLSTSKPQSTSCLLSTSFCEPHKITKEITLALLSTYTQKFVLSPLSSGWAQLLDLVFIYFCPD